MSRATGVGKDATQVSEPSEPARELVEAIYNKIWGEMTFTEAAAEIERFAQKIVDANEKLVKELKDAKD